ncbi:MAG: hypothetical protein ABI277_12125 [Burkholderiaceae bacterium]
MNETSRITPEEAEARFAALVAEHRNPNNRGAAPPIVRPSRDRKAALAVVLVYCLSVAAGVFWHAAPIVAVLIGAPTIYFVRLLRGSGRSGMS